MAGNIIVQHEFFDGVPEIYWGLYVSDTDIFSKAANNIADNDNKANLTFPLTCPININLLPPSVPTSDLHSLETGQGDRKQKLA